MAIHWASHRLERGPTLRIGLGFAIGSVCFLVAPFPGFVDLVGAEADAVVFFVGSLFFTAAALLQALGSEGADRLPSLIQFAGTIYFNVDTFRAMRAAFSDTQIDRLIWTPEAIGSACFLVSGVLAYLSVRAAGHAARRNAEWRIAAINLAGCVFFGISTVASYVVPKTGTALDLAAANWTTGLGALCFLLGALMVIRQAREPA
jgi:hypothetical protein